MKANAAYKKAYMVWGAASLIAMLIGVVILGIMAGASYSHALREALAGIPKPLLPVLFLACLVVWFISSEKKSFYKMVVDLRMSKQHYVWVKQFWVIASNFHRDWEERSFEEKRIFLETWRCRLSDVLSGYAPPPKMEKVKTRLEDVLAQINEALSHLERDEDDEALVRLVMAEEQSSLFDLTKKDEPLVDRP